MISICIPTIPDRRLFLEYLLRQLEAFIDGDIQIAVHHNDSGESPLQSLRNALDLAAEKYCLYVADDDNLLDAQIGDGINYLEQHPSCIAYIAPWQYENGKLAYQCEPKLLTKLDAVSFFNDICNHHILPEIGIYRTQSIKGLKLFQEGPYWAYTNLIELLKHGEIYISDKPFYRYYLQHPTGLKRETVGQKQLLSDMDTYRAGLEVYAYESFRFHDMEIPFEMVRNIQKGISDYMLVRLKNALAVAHNQGLERPDLWARIKAMGG